jgi:hypothetical protein
MKSTTTYAVLAGVTSIVALAGATSIISACNSGGNDPVSACTNSCEHFASCLGVSTGTTAADCQKSCADAGSLQASCKQGGSVTTYFNCIGSLPCSDFTSPDASIGAFEGCLTQSGCM